MAQTHASKEEKPLLSLHIFFDYSAQLTPKEIWSAIEPIHSDLSKGTIEDLFSDDVFSADKLGKRIELNNKGRFFYSLTTGQIRFSSAVKSSCKSTYLVLENFFEDDQYISNALNKIVKMDSFIYARVYNSEYDAIQNNPKISSLKRKNIDLTLFKIGVSSSPPPL